MQEQKRTQKKQITNLIYKMNMKFNFILLIVIITLFSCSSEKKQKELIKQKYVKTEINRNVETFGLILTLAEQDELFNYGFPKSAHLLRFNIKQFEKYKNHPVVQKAKELMEEKYLCFASIEKAIEYTQLPEFKRDTTIINTFENDSISQDEKSKIEEFYKLVRDFYIDAKMDSFFNANQKIYDKVLTELNKSLPDSNYFVTLEKYHGIEMAVYKIIPSIFIPNYFGFGPRIVTKNGIINYFLMGPGYDIKIDSAISNLSKIDSFGFNDKSYILKLGVHEFGHTFMRFLDKSENQKLIESVSYLNTPELIKNMKKQGYGGDWSECVEEHLVRLCEIRIAKMMGNTKLEKENYQKDAIERKFIYLPMLNKLVEEYEKDRKKYNKFEDFFPIIIENMKKIK